MRTSTLPTLQHSREISPMTRTLAAFAATALVMMLLDFIWLGYVAKPLYQQGMGHLMAEQPNIPVALLFYAIYATGLMLFAVLPHEAAEGWRKTLTAAALFGFFAYATYDLSNLATLKDWPASLTVLDIAWGSLVSLLSAAAGKLALDALAPT